MEELYILWTNDNRDTAENMVFMYAQNALKKRWWDKVTIIIWGATAGLAASDSAIQDRLNEMMSEGVMVSACISCAKNLGVSDKLSALGIELRKWGEPLTNILKEGKKLITV